MQCQCHTYLSIATTIAVGLLSLSNDKQECNSPITSVYHLPVTNVSVHMTI